MVSPHFFGREGNCDDYRILKFIGFTRVYKINGEGYQTKRARGKPFLNNGDFLFVGRLLDTKNVDKLCQQFISHFSTKNAKMIIVGDGDNLENYKKNYSKKNIFFMGSIYNEELIKIYNNASVFTFPSSLDAWGLVVNEALSAGLPVIARKEVGACSDLIEGKETGFIVDDMHDFGKMMLTLFNNSELLNNYSKNASDLMKNNWNYQLYNKCLNELIKKIENDNGSF